MDEAKMKALKAQIEASVAEESNDSEKYTSMAEMAPAEYASILLDIAKEERTHRMHLADILRDIKKRMQQHEAGPEDIV